MLFTDSAVILDNLPNDGWLDRLSVDWTLKTRLRFISRKPFPYKGFFTATENATGTTSFVRCFVSDKETPKTPGRDIKDSSSDSNPAPLDTSQVAILKKNCLVWIHPHIPGCELYPRIGSKAKSPGLSKPLLEEMLNEYCCSLKDLYDLLKVRHCAYFYLCANSFTVLFKASGVGGINEMSALICPTTEGIRKKLKEQGIEFSLPFYENEQQNSQNDENEVNW